MSPLKLRSEIAVQIGSCRVAALMIPARILILSPLSGQAAARFLNPIGATPIRSLA